MSTPGWQLAVCYERPIAQRTHLSFEERDRLLCEAIEQLQRDRAPHRRIRSARLELARFRGRHTAEEWEALKAEFDQRCVRCGADGHNLDRDHIIPIYQATGNPYCSDAIENIQPLCARCNSSKGSEITNWAAIRRARGFVRG